MTLKYRLKRFDQNLVKLSSARNHLEMVLGTKLDFSLHLKNVQNKVIKATGHFCKLQNTLPRSSLIIIFKSLIRPHLDYGDMIYDCAHKTLRFIKMSIQYNLMH